MLCDLSEICLRNACFSFSAKNSSHAESNPNLLVLDFAGSEATSIYVARAFFLATSRSSVLSETSVYLLPLFNPKVKSVPMIIFNDICLVVKC